MVISRDRRSTPRKIAAILLFDFDSDYEVFSHLSVNSKKKQYKKLREKLQ